MSTKGHIVFVTGAAGFLGERIVQLLDCKGDNIREIRGFDIRDQGKYFTDNHDNSKLRYIKGDISALSQVKEALKGVDVVIHTASVMNIARSAEAQMMSRRINIVGTETVISGCIEAGVKGLVYTSSEAVVKGWERNKLNIDESKPYPGNNASYFSSGYYGYSKMEAEKRVIEANGCLLSSGENLATCSLRLMSLYGENNPVLNSILNASKNKNVVLLDAGSTFMQFLYVGNAAWAHVLAAKCILTKPEVISGKYYYITDDTPVQSINDIVTPFALASGYSISIVPIPHRVVYFITLLLEWLLWLVSPFASLSLPFMSHYFFISSANLTFASDKAQKDFDYLPIYPSQCAIERIEHFYRERD